MSTDFDGLKERRIVNRRRFLACLALPALTPGTTSGQEETVLSPDQSIDIAAFPQEVFLGISAGSNALFGLHRDKKTISGTGCHAGERTVTMNRRRIFPLTVIILKSARLPLENVSSLVRIPPEMKFPVAALIATGR
jgi:hypothetical protein